MATSVRLAGSADDRRRAARLLAAGLSAATALIYALIGLGVVSVVDETSDRAPDLLTFGLAAGAAYLLGAVLLLAVDNRVLWILGSMLQVGVIAMYVAVASNRTPPFEAWGLTIKVLQLALLGVPGLPVDQAAVHCRAPRRRWRNGRRRMSSPAATRPATGSVPVSALRAWASDLRAGGALLFAAGAIILLGIITAESLYPGTYSTGASQISDLGGTEPPNSVVLQPSAAIFDVSMMVVGLLVLAGSAFVHRAFGRRSVTIPLAVLGAGALGVGVFPGNTGSIHAVCATTTFVSGGVAAICAGRLARGPFRYLSVTLGAIALLSFGSYVLLGEANPMRGLGIGGVERWIVYPIVLWVTGFGAYLAGRADGDTAAPGVRERRG